MRRSDITGQRFGRLVALQDVASNPNGIRIWECQCDCGNLARILVTSLRHGNTRSCGCLRVDLGGMNTYNHGHCNGSLSPTYKSWLAMRRRCQDTKNRSYARYGGRGIKVCDCWKKFENFLADMGERPKGKTIDRIDNDGDYTPRNCKWSTPKQQAQNRK